MHKDAENNSALLINSFNEMTAIYETLSNDLRICIEELKKDNDSQFWRRTLIRTVFAFIEGLIYGMKQITLEMSDVFELNFSQSQLALLSEQSYDLNEKGLAKAKPKFLELTSNVRFTFDAFSQAFKIDFSLKVDDSDWLSFRQALKTRHRLTHPKKTKELIVSDDELHTALKGLAWFTRSTDEIFSKVKGLPPNTLLNLRKIRFYKPEGAV